MREISLHILDLAANSISAGATKIKIEIEEDQTTDTLLVRITDNGKGLNPEMITMVTDLFVKSRTERKVALGLPLLKEAA